MLSVRRRLKHSPEFVREVPLPAPEVAVLVWDAEICSQHKKLNWKVFVSEEWDIPSRLWDLIIVCIKDLSICNFNSIFILLTSNEMITHRSLLKWEMLPSPHHWTGAGALVWYHHLFGSIDTCKAAAAWHNHLNFIHKTLKLSFNVFSWTEAHSVHDLKQQWCGTKLVLGMSFKMLYYNNGIIHCHSWLMVDASFSPFLDS